MASPLRHSALTMASALFWTLILTVTAAKAFPVFQDALIANYPWFGGYNPAWHNGFYSTRPYWGQVHWGVPQVQGLASTGASVIQPTPQEAEINQGQGGGGKPAEQGSDGGATHEDEYGFPRYGGSCPISRYGIRYDRQGRNRPRRTRYRRGHAHPSHVDPYDLPPSSIFSESAKNLPNYLSEHKP